MPGEIRSEYPGDFVGIRNRFIVLHVDPPDQHARYVVLQRLFEQVLSRMKAQLSPTLESKTLILLGEISPRRARLVLDLGIANAVTAQREYVDPDDFREAVRLVGAGTPRRMGF